MKLRHFLQWLWLCAGETTTDCRKLNMNAESPSWTTAANLPYPPRHGAMYSYGGHLYMLGGWTADGCRNYHYRISESGSSWEGRAAYERNIHRHTAVVDEQQVKFSLLFAV